MSRSEFLDESAAANVVAKARTFMSGDAQFFSSQPNFDQIRKQLESESVSNKKEGMKRIIAQIALGSNMSQLFPDVVKNVHFASIELRKLIYYFIVHYSEERPNEALLSISAFQHDLLDSSMHVRSLALRTLSSIRIAAINPVVLVAIKKASTDMSPIVRRTAALAIAKASKIARGEDNQAQIIPILQQLLGDRSMDVVGAAASTFLQLCPDRFDLIHKHFRRICRGLLECDEWGQVDLLHLLLRYARNQFTAPDKPRPVAPKPKKETSDSDSDSDSDQSDLNVNASSLDLDSDHRLLLNSVKPLFFSLNRAVVLGAASLFYHVAPQIELDYCARPLLRVLTGDADGHYVALMAINSFIGVRQKPFVPYVRDFYLAPHDSNATRQLRLRILARLTTKENLFQIVNEVKCYLRSYDTSKVVDAIKCLGLMTYTVNDATPSVIKLILPLLSHKRESVVTEAVVVLRQLVVQSGDKTQTCQIVQKLAQRVLKNEVTAPAARASIIWLVGENIRTHANIAKVAPDMFRAFVKSFVNEDAVVKGQVIVLGAKIWVNLEGEGELAERFKAIFFHLLELVKYDKDYDIRDQGRLVQTALNRGAAAFEAIKTAALAPRPLPQRVEAARPGVHLGSMTHVLGTSVTGYTDVVEWPLEQPDVTTRDPPRQSSSSSSDSDSESSNSSDSDSDSESVDSDVKARASAKRAKDSEDSSSDDDGSDNDGSSSDSAEGGKAKAAVAKAPTAVKTAAKAIAAPVRVKVVAKVMAKAPAPARDRVAELFTPKPAARGAHVDPAQPAASAFVDAVTMADVQVSYCVDSKTAGEHLVTLRFVNRRDGAIGSVGLSDDHELGDALLEHSEPLLDLAASGSGEVTLRLTANQPEVQVPITIASDDGDEDEDVCFSVRVPLAA